MSSAGPGGTAAAAAAKAAQQKWQSVRRSPSGLSCPFFSGMYQPTHNANFHHSKNTMDRSQHPLHFLFSERIDSRSKQGLWWSVQAHNALSQKSTIRHYARRKLVHSWIRVLARNGFNEDGFPTSTDTKLALWGSLRLSVTANITTASHTQLDAASLALLQCINPNHTKTSSPSPPKS